MRFTFYLAMLKVRWMIGVTTITVTPWKSAPKYINETNIADFIITDEANRFWK